MTILTGKILAATNEEQIQRAEAVANEASRIMKEAWEKARQADSFQSACTVYDEALCSSVYHLIRIEEAGVSIYEETFAPGRAGSITSHAMHWNPTSIRELERKSIREFLERHKEYLQGWVLDFGAGKPGTCAAPQPYRDLVTGDYEPFDLGDKWPTGPFDTILCTQVIQYVIDPRRDLGWFAQWLKRGSHLVMTGPTNWEEVEDSDLWRFTRAGIRKLVEAAGFQVLTCESRAEIDLGGAKFSLGWGVVARKL